jgi:hypothetical protein
MPVTTTIGLPNLSRGADMVPPSMLRRILRRAWTAIVLYFWSRMIPAAKTVPVCRIRAYLIASTRAMPSPCQ